MGSRRRLGWGDAAQYMGPNIADHASGVFWGAFALFAATTASIMSGSVIERIQTVGFTILAIIGYVAGIITYIIQYSILN